MRRTKASSSATVSRASTRRTRVRNRSCASGPNGGGISMPGDGVVCVMVSPARRVSRGAPSMACRPAGAGPPHPHPLPQGARGQLSQGGAPPHTPPRRSTRGASGLLKGGLPPTPPLDDPLGVPGLGWQAGGCAGWAAGFPRRRSAPWRAAPAPPHPHPLPQGARGPIRALGGCGRADPGGGVGAQPPHQENPRVGGWATSRAARSSGMGVWGAQPPAGDARCALGGLSSGGRRTPSPPPSPARGEGAGRGLASCGRAADPAGAWGRGQGWRLDSTARLCYGARGWFV